jgi:urease accessory protein
MLRFILMVFALAGELASPALAHTGVGQVNSFASGIAHPLSGADHILTIVCLGLWALLAGGRAIWMWPTTFVAAMLVGFAAASASLPMPLVEPIISLSVVTLGVFVAMAANAPLWLGATVAALFAFFHGHAHGAEAAAENLIPYAAGFVLTTVALQAGTIGVGLLAKGSIGTLAVRATGGVAVLGGLALIVG